MLNLTENYLNRPVDQRMVNIIEGRISVQNSILDMGCGSGLYGKYLKSKCKKLFGLDRNELLCQRAKDCGFYDNILCRDVKEICPSFFGRVDLIFCSELLEHIENADIVEVLRRMEAICDSGIIITMPNPLSPHFKLDSSHVLKYNISSFLKILNSSGKFKYKLYSLGFSEFNLKKFIYKAFNVLSRRVAILSPTILYIGEVREKIKN
jgi:2-polyprenyl-3-methyl-5-hydroxy-6-metoxy-1,4-benzoquinol methylase